jgi:glutathione synthase/RimK-type ligase-like ATP-grasp enzyme
LILIITNKEDVHPTPVIAYLNEWRVPVFRLNTEALLTDYQVHWWHDGTRADFSILNIKNGLEARGSEITAVWERRPEAPVTLPVEGRPEINKHNLVEARGFLSFLSYYVKDVFSIGSIVNDRVAASKMLQLEVASALGMTVPRTCFSNRQEDVLAFARNHEHVLLKSIANDNVWLDDEHEYVFYARKVRSADLFDQPGEMFTQTVNFVQEYVEKAFELRVTVVDETVFACRLDSQALDDDKGRIDWRQGYEHGLKHEIYELPPRVATFCRDYLRRVGLHFGCFDMIVTPGGDHVFLECNPNGQWLWIEMKTGMKIAGEIASVLSRAGNRLMKQEIHDTQQTFTT